MRPRHAAAALAAALACACAAREAAREPEPAGEVERADPAGSAQQQPAADPVAALRELAARRAEALDARGVAKVDREIDAAIARLPDSDSERAAEQIGPRVPAARILVVAAERALGAGDPARARSLAERAARLPLDPEAADRLSRLRERLASNGPGAPEASELPTLAALAGIPAPSTAGARGTLGVVLPLSGPFARPGEESLRGILLAAGIFPPGEGGTGTGSSIRLLVRDSAGRPELAAAAVRELAEQEEVVAIVGPLGAAECEAAAAEAEAHGLPLLALTPHEGVVKGRTQVFRLRTLPSEEVALLAGHAFSDLGARRFAILYPRDDYGRRLRGLFWDAVEARGGKVVAVASYEAGENDFGDSIRHLLGYELLTPAEEAAIKEREGLLTRARRLPPERAQELRAEARARLSPDGGPLPPIVDFDALFIPESYEKVVLIAPQLAFHEATGMRLLGPSVWDHPDLVRIGQEHVRGSIFVAHFFAESPLPVVRDFTTRFRAGFEASPDVFAAQAYDAANLALLQLARGRDSREEMREGLLGVRAHPGVSGVLSMGADGNAHKRPFLLGVERGRIVELDL
jgi:ABC-type branched-subunit amino acid transport system substrate-binding protein